MDLSCSRLQVARVDTPRLPRARRSPDKTKSLPYTAGTDEAILKSEAIPFDIFMEKEREIFILGRAGI